MTLAEIGLLASLALNATGLAIALRGNQRVAIQTQIAENRMRMDETDRAYGLQLTALKTTIDELRAETAALKVQADAWRQEAQGWQEHAQRCDRALTELQSQVARLTRERG